MFSPGSSEARKSQARDVYRSCAIHTSGRLLIPYLLSKRTAARLTSADTVPLTQKGTPCACTPPPLALPFRIALSTHPPNLRYELCSLSSPRRAKMRGYSIVLSSAVLCFLLGSFSATAQDAKDTPDAQSPRWYNPKRYNPLKLINRGPKSANDQLASNGDLEAKLTHQLQVQGILPRDKNLQDVCSSFKYLDECVASLRVSRTLLIDFSCLKWDVTGVKPKPVSDSCAGPSDGKAMSLHRAIDLLKPDSDARREANDALRRARDDIKDAGG